MIEKWAIYSIQNDSYKCRCCFDLFMDGMFWRWYLLPMLWYERSRRHGNINSAAVGPMAWSGDSRSVSAPSSTFGA